MPRRVIAPRRMPRRVRAPRRMPHRMPLRIRKEVYRNRKKKHPPPYMKNTNKKGWLIWAPRAKQEIIHNSQISILFPFTLGFLEWNCLLDTINVTLKASIYKFIILEIYDVVEVKTNNVIFKCPNLEHQFRDITLLVILKT